MIVVHLEQHPDGGYTAEVEGHSIFTQGETLEEVCANAREAVYCHFEDAYWKPPQIAFDIPVGRD